MLANLPTVHVIHTRKYNIEKRVNHNYIISSQLKIEILSDMNRSTRRPSDVSSLWSNGGRKRKSQGCASSDNKLDADLVPEVLTFFKGAKGRQWLQKRQAKSYVDQSSTNTLPLSCDGEDPREQIASYFDLVAKTAPAITGRKSFIVSPKASVFTVWRPTSMDAIVKMINGEGVGKGLDIKGKSAQRGKLSGFVPFLQIHKNKDKRRIHTLRKDSNMRIFYQLRELRDAAFESLTTVLEEMVAGYEEAQRILKNPDADEESKEAAMGKYMWALEEHAAVCKVDDYAAGAEDTSPVYGLTVPERVFWEAYVVRQTINRMPGSEDDIGRPSEPAFQDMNFESLRLPPNEENGRQVVIYQRNTRDAMNPKDLLVAYEEDNRVMPVVSDFDCFLVGTRSVAYTEPIPDDQVELVKWSLDKMESILSGPALSKTWTGAWLEVLKEDSFHPEMPAYGFGDPKSYSIMERAAKRLCKDGSVRHGAECFNYYFPQELDENFLVIGQGMGMKGLSWMYVDQCGLQKLLKTQIKRGYTFPLNPKWIICDKGWNKVFDKLCKSTDPVVQDSLDCWYPPSSGIKERIQSLSTAYPKGFVRAVAPCSLVGSLSSRRLLLEKSLEVSGTSAMDLAAQELKNYRTLQRAKRKFRAALIWMKFAKERRKILAAQHSVQGGATKSDESVGLEWKEYAKSSFTTETLVNAGAFLLCIGCSWVLHNAVNWG